MELDLVLKVSVSCLGQAQRRTPMASARSAEIREDVGAFVNRNKGSIVEMIVGTIAAVIEETIGETIEGTIGETIEEMIAETTVGKTEGMIAGTIEETTAGTIEETTAGTIEGMIGETIEEMIEGTIDGTIDGMIEGTIGGTIEGTIEETTVVLSGETTEGMIGEGTIGETTIVATLEPMIEDLISATVASTILVSRRVPHALHRNREHLELISRVNFEWCIEEHATEVEFIPPPIGRNQRQDSYVSEFPTLSSTGAGPGPDKARESAEHQNATARPNQQAPERQQPPSRQDLKGTQSQAGPTPTTHKFKSGQRVFAKYWEDNRMYRAVVHEMAATGETCVVQFVEYGNYEEVSSSPIRCSNNGKSIERMIPIVFQ